MSLIIMAVHDTVDNKRTAYTEKTLNGLLDTVDFGKHRLIIVDNASCDDTHELYVLFLKELCVRGVSPFAFEVIKNTDNIGTARAINLGLKKRKPKEFCIKMDNDVVIHTKNWIEEMEEAMAHDPNIAILGLKRKDLDEHPDHTHPFYKSKLKMLEHTKGERWIIVEQVENVMGTCTMFNHSFLDKVGFMWQAGKYGMDDSEFSFRGKLCGMTNCFLPHILIDHIDVGGDEYCSWKQRSSAADMDTYAKHCQDMKMGRLPVFYDGGFND